jgi:hypothetical protein
MEEVIVYYIIGILVSLLPIYLLLGLGPKRTRHRGIFFIIGLGTAALAGGILYLISIDERFPMYNPSDLIPNIARVGLAGIVEELLRYPGILIAQIAAIRYFERKGTTVEEELINSDVVVDSRFVGEGATSIFDPHGMGAYFGVGYGLGETIVFYIWNRIVLIREEIYDFVLIVEVQDIVFRITAVMAHTALTYLALAITSKKSYWRVTISLHVSVNIINKIFEELAPNYAARLVMVMFTRFSLVLITYFFLRPRVRYQSPMVLFFLLVILMLSVILLSTFLLLLSNLLTGVPIETLPT